MFFVIEFFVIIVFYQFHKNGWILLFQILKISKKYPNIVI